MWTRSTRCRSQSPSAHVLEEVICDLQRDRRALFITRGEAQQVERAVRRVSEHTWRVGHSSEHGLQTIVEVAPDRLLRRFDYTFFVAAEQRRLALDRIE